MKDSKMVGRERRYTLMEKNKIEIKKQRAEERPIYQKPKLIKLNRIQRRITASPV